VWDVPSRSHVPVQRDDVGPDPPADDDLLVSLRLLDGVD
jgi:hypothetical protein